MGRRCSSSIWGYNGQKKSVEPAEATFGFQRASRISVQTSNSLEIEALDNEYEATPMGERVAQLYIDPLSADILLEGLRRLLGELFVIHFQSPVSHFVI